MLRCVQALIEALNSQEIRYCHWKSNLQLQDALAGQGDLDLLVGREDAQRFAAIVAATGFKRAIDPVQTPRTTICHYYGLDPETGVLVHLHVFYRVLTGESLLKDYHLPLEDLLLSHTHPVQGMPVPDPAAELIVYVVRMMVKHTNLLEYALLRRRGEDLPAEAAYLLTAAARERYAKLLQRWLPAIELALFNQCLACLQAGESGWRLVGVSLRLRRQLWSYRRLSSLVTCGLRVKIFSQRLGWRLWGAGKSKQLVSGGAVIAFVGPEATGKSTLVAAVTQWLGQTFNVRSAHLGKPPGSGLSTIPNLMLPVLRRLAPQQRTMQMERELDQQGRPASLLYGLRSVLVAWDRRKLAAWVHRRAANGELVICDRYPSLVTGAMDSPRLVPPEGEGWRQRLLRQLAAWEQQLYRQVPAPDMVIQLTVPTAVAIERNRQRHKANKESDAEVQYRHSHRLMPIYPNARTLTLDTDQPQAETIRQARQMVWEML